MAQILKPRHSLIGRSLIPIIMKLKAWDSETSVVEYSRLKKDHPLEAYTLQELRGEFEKLTGEVVKDVLLLAGMEENIDSVRLLMHHTIVHANVSGAPRGQVLEQPIATRNNADTPVTTQPGGKQQTATNNGAGTSGEDTVAQLRSIREDINALKSRKDELQVDEALTTVRTLASRPNLTSTNVLVAAIETLVEVAQKANHKDSILYSKAFNTCKKFEDSDGFCDLVLKLFGTSEDKKVASVVADWAKSKKYESEKKSDDKVTSLGQQQQPAHNFMPYTYPYAMGYPPMFMSPQYRMPNYGFRNAQRGIRPRKPKATSNCYYCNEAGHFVSDCPKLKKK